MFAAETKALVKITGAEEDLISNCNLNKKMDILTLVRVKRGTIFQYPTYKPMNITLPELMEEKDFSPELEEKVLVNDFKTWIETSGSGKLKGGHEVVGEADISANYDSVDGLSESVSINKKKVNLSDVRSKFSGRRINEGTLNLLKLKEKHTLAVVYETVYNSGPVTIIRKGKKDGCISASFHKMANLVFKGNSKEDTTFTVPENSTFAFSLVEVLLKDGTMEISLESWSHKRRGLSHDGINSEMIQQVRDGIEMKEVLLKPLEKLPELTRRDLLKGLQDVLEEGNTLSLLEELLDQSSKGESERPPSKAVSSFMDLLDESRVSGAVKDSVHLLVTAMEALPEIVLRPLTSCGPDTLTVLTQLVESLRDEVEARLPECPPGPLQQDGELRWAADPPLFL
ncbi:uncharacterized protein FYW61_015424 isoform 2-T2 [Anableps anableps]